MSDEILPKSRTELDKQSFTRDDNDQIARRVTDNVTHAKLDDVINALGGAVGTSVYYSEVLSVATGVLTTVVSHTATANKKLKSASCSGTNIAMFEVQLNNITIAKKYTNFGGPLDIDFDFSGGQDLILGDVIAIKVTHSRPQSGNFNGTLFVQD